jgi:hypothetical protein
MAVRLPIDLAHQDVKEVWGAGQQQMRSVFAGIGAFTVNLVLYSVGEVWAGRVRRRR